MRLGQVLAVRALLLVQIRDGVQPQSVDAHLEPEIHRLEYGFLDALGLEVEIGLVVVEAMPVVLLGNRIPCPVRPLEVLEDDSRVLVFLRVVGPDVEVASGGPLGRAAGSLKPGC